MGNGLVVTSVSLIYLIDEFFYLFLVQLNEMRALGESMVLPFLSGVNQGNEGEFKISLCYPGVRDLPLNPFASEVV